MKNAILITALLLASAQASATLIEYDATNIGGNRWQYDYTVTNDTLAFAIEEFTIFFDEDSYANLAVSASPAGWDSLVAQPDSTLMVPGFSIRCPLSSQISNSRSSTSLPLTALASQPRRCSAIGLRYSTRPCSSVVITASPIDCRVTWARRYSRDDRSWN